MRIKLLLVWIYLFILIEDVSAFSKRVEFQLQTNGRTSNKLTCTNLSLNLD